MAIVPGSTVSRIDPGKLRHPLNKDDLELNAAAQAWLVSIEASERPMKLAAAFPRIVNRMAKLWKMPLQMDRYFEDLLTDHRGNRQGFPLGVLMELSALKDYYLTRVYPTRRDLWDS
jgi:hypothetical protein